MLQNACVTAKFGFDTAESEPAKNLQILAKFIIFNFAKFANFAAPNPLTPRRSERGAGPRARRHARRPRRAPRGGRQPRAAGPSLAAAGVKKRILGITSYYAKFHEISFFVQILDCFRLCRHRSLQVIFILHTNNYFRDSQNHRPEFSKNNHFGTVLHTFAKYR